MQGEHLVKPIEFLDTMHPPPQFTLISKAYTDGITLRKDGPQITKEFSSECTFDTGKSFRTAVNFTPKLVPKHFVTTLTVADELTYYESIAFERRTVMQNFSETTNVFLPKEKTAKYVSMLFFDPDPTKKLYVIGTELIPAQKFIVTQESNCNGEGDAIESKEKSEINGDISSNHELINGKVTEIVQDC